MTGIDDLALSEMGKVFIEEPSDIKEWIRLTTAGPFDEGEFKPTGKNPFKSIVNKKTPVILVKKSIKQY